MAQQTKIAVIGSINMDVVSHVRKYPDPGETVMGLGTDYIPGGKGANQAVAAARAGARVTMIGAVGTDSFGPVLVSALQRDGIDHSCVSVKSASSGLAFIVVDEEGQNRIILSPGANGLLTAEEGIRAFRYEQALDVLLVQNEIHWDTTQAVVLEAHRLGIKVCFNPAPVSGIDVAILPFVDVLFVNEIEAGEIAGVAMSHPDFLHAVTESFMEFGVSELVITLGEKGCYYASSTGDRIAMDAFKVAAVDTTAAGDTFIGAFSASYFSGESITTALRYASAASAMAVTRLGAQTSIPSIKEIAKFLSEHPVCSMVQGAD